MAGVNINQGTQTNIATDTVGTTEYQKIKLDIGAAGASSLFTGTLGAVTNLAGGTVSAVNNMVKGTVTRVEGGTINVTGTPVADNFTFRHADAFGTVINIGTSALGTVKAAVSGSAIYVTDLIISATSATDVFLASGTVTKPITGTLYLDSKGGIAMTFKTPINTASGSALIYKQSADVGLSITCLGYVD